MGAAVKVVKGIRKHHHPSIPLHALDRAIGKMLAAVATLGTGNSLGPEGPAVELGVASSRCLSTLSTLSVERQRMLLGAGAAAGVAAGFNAPIAGVFFSLEIVKVRTCGATPHRPSALAFCKRGVFCPYICCSVWKVAHGNITRPCFANLLNVLQYWTLWTAAPGDWEFLRAHDDASEQHH